MDALKTIYRPPLIGAMAFLVVLFTQPIGHSVMILTEKFFGAEYKYLIATLLGLVGAVCVYIGAVKKTDEVSATWLGYFGGTFLWSFWAEFSYVFYGEHLGVQPLLKADGSVATLPEYLIMPSSLGVLMCLFVYFFLNKDTRCNFFRWFHRNLHMGMGKPAPGKNRNFALITAAETIVIIWFFYIALLLIYDNRIIGEGTVMAKVAFYGFMIWSIFLLSRLARYSRMTSALRYAIATAIITWNCVEMGTRFNYFTEFWIHPTDYIWEVLVVLLALFIVIGLSMMTPSRNKAPDDLLEAHK